MTSAAPPRINILFVCMGNICRSPMAECVFRHKAKARGLEHRLHIDSAGTGNWHAGQPPDERVVRIGRKYGVPITGRARQITHADFDLFDMILVMDEMNLEHVLGMGAPEQKIRLLLECDSAAPRREVPDPYEGGMDGFETVYELLDSACEALLDQVEAMCVPGDDAKPPKARR